MDTAGDNLLGESHNVTRYIRSVVLSNFIRALLKRLRTDDKVPQTRENLEQAPVQVEVLSQFGDLHDVSQQ